MTRRNRCLVQADTVTREIPAPAGGVVIETFVPWKMVRRGVRKRILTPMGEPEAFAGDESADAGAEDSPMLRALGLAHYWQRLLDEQRVASAEEIAEAERLDISYVRRLLRLNLIDPFLLSVWVRTPSFKVDSILGQPLPRDWLDQRRLNGSAAFKP